MCKVNPEWEKYVTMENGKKKLYLRLNKALYGCIRSAMLWYNLFRETLEEMGFEINPYDPCVANKMINGKQCTIMWYVDDLKVSHMSRKAVVEILRAIKARFHGDLTITLGKEHTYLGMKITFPDDGKVEIRISE